uniref:Glycoprotein 41 n=1 Tax=Lymantria dispar multicapsid nuclear polyhedrosis virus TaxID=10449 RepID=A0A1B1MQV3_NPVLD|nr:glycoprotein 41 [Lymantria dispar multiple nucleopolyhedrovirus]
MSHLTPQMQLLINTIRDLCLETNPVDVNVVKRFDSDENLIKHYARLAKDMGGTTVPDNIFQASFVYSVLPSYAQKFYNRGAVKVDEESVSNAAKQLSLAVQYQIAQAVATNTPIPLPFTQQLANEYMTCLLQQATIPPNIQKAVETGKYPQLNSINTLVNNVIDSIFSGGGDYYYYILNEHNRARVISLKENIGFLAPLSSSVDIFQYVADLATKAGKRPDLFSGATLITSSNGAGDLSKDATSKKTVCQRSLTELAFQNEALRRFIFQQLSYKHNNRPSTFA